MSKNHVYKSLSQVWFRRVYRARGLMWSSGVFLNDGSTLFAQTWH